MAVARTLRNDGTRNRIGHGWFARAAVATVTATLVAGTAIMGAGNAVATTVPTRDGTELSAPLAELARTGVDPGTPEAAAIVGLSSSGAGSLQTDSTNRLAVTVRFSTTPTDSTIEAIAALDAEVSVSKRHAAASVLVAPARLPELAAIPTVTAVVPALAPQLAAGQNPATAARDAAVPNATAPDVLDCRSIPVDADAPLRTAAARERFGVDGTGVKVGVISDSFDVSSTAATTAAQDIGMGVLPGPGNPCGYLTPVHVLDESAEDASDEGRAMAQLVHGVAPGAELMFASFGYDRYTMADRIIALADAGAQIIVDDVQFLDDTSYQDGVVSSAVRDVTARGVIYVAIAGNNNVVGAADGGSAGEPIGSWATDRYDPVSCPAGLVAQLPWLDESTTDCANFAIDDGDDGTPDRAARNGIRIDDDSPITATLQWAEPADGVNADFTVAVTDENAVVVASQQHLDPDVPVVVLDITTPDGPGFYYISILRHSDPGSATDITPAFTLGFWQSYLSIGDLQYHRSGTGQNGARITVGPTVWGHSGGVDSFTVGASESDVPDVVSWFSSLGPVEHLFEPWRMDGTPSAPLAQPHIISKPDAISVNWVRTSFFRPTGSDQDEYRFTGTSAAAPLAAGVFALGLQRAPQAGAAAQRAAIVATATAVQSSLPSLAAVNASGAGLINAEAYLAALPTTPTTTPTAVAPAQTGPTALAATGAHTNVLGGFGLAALAAGLLTTGLLTSGLLVPALAVRRRASRR